MLMSYSNREDGDCHRRSVSQPSAQEGDMHRSLFPAFVVTGVFFTVLGGLALAAQDYIFTAYPER